MTANIVRMCTESACRRFGFFTVAIAVSLVAAHVARAGDKHALLIGIGQYEWRRIDSLPGAPNDVHCMERILVREYGFLAENVEKLLDQQATLSGIRAAFQRLKSRSRASDTIVIHYSGHGTTLPDDNGDELESNPGDVTDEALVPYDLGEGYANILRDDELGRLLDSLSASTMYVILDSCFSGTGTKSLGGRRSRRRVLPNDLQRKSAGLSSDRAPLSRDVLAGAKVANSQRRVVFSACDSQQEASEIEIDDVTRNVFVGAFSRFFMEGLRSSADADGNGVVTNREALLYANRRMDEVVNTSTVAFSERQTPQIEYSDPGLGDAPVFDTAKKLPMYSQITSVTGMQVQLDAGAIHGLRLDQVLGVFGKVNDISQTPLSTGRLKIKSVGLAESQAEIELGNVVSGNVVAPLFNPLSRADVFINTEVEPDVKNQSVAFRVKQQIDRRLQNESGIRIGAASGYELRLKVGQLATNVVGQVQVTLQICDARDIQVLSVKQSISDRPLDQEFQDFVRQMWKPVEDKVRELRVRRNWGNVTNPHPPFHLQLVVDRASNDPRSMPEYRIGETMKFGLKATTDCWYWLIVVDPAGESSQLMEQPMFAPAGTKLLFPGPGKLLRIDGPDGVSVVKLIAIRQSVRNTMPTNWKPTPEQILALDPDGWNESSTSWRVKP